VFERTGGLHAAGLFSADGRLLCAREDVGRHNAVDKVVGHTVLDRRSNVELASCVLMVSGRVSFEITQKAALAGIGIIAAVSAPSSLAVSAAERLGVALIAFVRDRSFNLYSHAERIALES
jgi:FdhD protein